MREWGYSDKHGSDGSPQAVSWGRSQLQCMGTVTKCTPNSGVIWTFCLRVPTGIDVFDVAAYQYPQVCATPLAPVGSIISQRMLLEIAGLVAGWCLKPQRGVSETLNIDTSHDALM